MIKKISIISFVLIAISIAVFLIIRSEKDTVFPLKNGSRGSEVSELQKWLNSQNVGYSIAVDGIFGEQTEKLLYTVTGEKQMSKKTFKKTV